MKVYEALASAFVEEGTSSIFGLMGHANQEWIDAIVKLGVDMYEARHEGAACAMADGWARQRNQPAVCTTTSGPGTSQLTTALIVAKRAGSPLVAFCGDQPLKASPWERDGASQSMDQKLFAQAAESGFVQMTSPETAYESVQRAFYLARTESRPIVLSAPHDIQTMTFVDDDERYVPSSSFLSAAAVAPNQDVILAAADLLEKCEKPVIIVGKGAMTSEAKDAVLSLASRVGVLVATSLVAINWLRDAEPFHAGVSGLYATRVAQELFQEADCVLGIGASLNMYTMEGGYQFPDASFVAVSSGPRNFSVSQRRFVGIREVANGTATSEG